MTQSTTRWQLFENDTRLTDATVDYIMHCAHAAIQARGAFLIVLAGGSTPRQVYAALRQQTTDWHKWHIYFNDDRCLPHEHIDRNSTMALNTWLSHVPIPTKQIHIIPSELGAVMGASLYADTLSQVADFDLVLLGLGEDGHTASLFPNFPLDNQADAVPVFLAPKPPPERVTMSQARLNRTQHALFMISGKAKQDAVDAWRRGAPIPASLIQAQQGVDIYCTGVVLQN